MSTNETPDLLRAYVDQGSEAAFRELVSRYVNLVYSVALRRVNGDTHFAEDVVQAVFTDLARKAASLPGNVMLGGWLHRHTGFVAGNMLRAEQRRTAREQEAVAMNLLSSDADWQQVAPLLDEAIDLLEAADRDAIVLRYFEQRDLRTVGLALGVTEDTAQKRVSRAVEKLRGLLVERGATLTVAVLATALATQAVIAAPANLAARVGKTAMKATAGAGLLALLFKAFSSTSAKLTVGAVVITVAAVGWLRPRETKETAKPSLPAAAKKASAANPKPPVAAGKTAPSPATVVAAVAPPPATNAPELRLTIVSAETGKPLRNVQVKMRAYAGNKFSGQTFRANKDGVCDVAFAREKTTSVELTTQIEGYADTKLQWRPDHGEVVPANYALRLIRATPIGGTVVDADGQPVAGAKIGFNHEDDLETKSLTENHEFGYIEVTTDAAGRWRINRIAADMIRRVRGGGGKHPDHLDGRYKSAAHDPEMEKQLRASTYVSQLGRPIEIRGLVVDAEGKPMAGADVMVGGRSMSDRRKSKAEADGTFIVRGCKPGKNLLSADVKGFATATMEIEAAADSAPFRLVVQRGKSLRLRIVNKDGTPVPGASVGLETNPFNPVNPAKAKPVVVASQASFSAKADTEGRIVWDGAPDTELTLYVQANNHMEVRDLKIRPDGEEHVVTLPSALVISGTVSDAESGGLIPKFRILTGYPRIDFKPRAGATYNPAGPQMVTNAQWSTIERFWLTFANGKYRHAFDEPVVGGDRNRGYYLKFEAEGYAPYVSRLIQADEGEALINVALRPARTLVVAVLQPEGSPASSADVGLVSPGASLSLAPGGLSRKNPQSGGALMAADAKGQFKLAPDDSITQVIITHASGFSETTVAALATDSTVRLQPWGNVEGIYLSGGKPAAGREIKFEYGKAEQGAITSDFTDFRVETDAQGRFTFNKVPPGKHKLVRLVPTKPMPFPGMRPGTKSWSTEQMGDIEVRAGETTSVTFGTNNYSIILRPRWPKGLKRTENSRMDILLSTPMPASLRELRKDAKSILDWQKTPEFLEWAANQRRFTFAENADGTFTAEGIPAGSYTVALSVMEMEPGISRQTAMGTVKVTVPADPPGGTLDLGDVVLEKPSPK